MAQKVPPFRVENNAGEKHGALWYKHLFYICCMRKLTSILLLLLGICFQAEAEYIDHRNHNTDSLETVMAGWTADRIASASETELRHVAKDLYELTWGFKNTNSVKSEHNARRLLEIASRMGWDDYSREASKCIGEHFWAKEKYDSAAFYFGIAMEMAERMPVTETGADHVATYSQADKDDALSQMYGALGNLYSMMDSTDAAMAYYEKAGVLFKKNGWNNSCSTLYYNMGETMRYENDYRKAEEYYKESLEYSLLAEDSLAVATAYKGLGSLYMEKGRAVKALKYLTEANSYFADHEKEELQFRMESLDYTGQVLAFQKRRLWIIIMLLLTSLALAAVTYWVTRSLKRTSLENAELTEVLEGTVEAISPVPEQKPVRLKPREREILDLISKGFTNAEIAEGLCLSQETIKWYKKKLFAMFDASNSAELVRIVKERNIL